MTIYKTFQVPDDKMKECFDLVKENMYDLDVVSSLGWNDEEKLKEMKKKDGFYLIFDEGFVSIRFEIRGSGIMTYLWEIQLKKDQRRKGLGKEMMTVIEKIAKKAMCTRVSLLVLKCLLFSFTLNATLTSNSQYRC